jgi:hypothetical protein
VTLAQVVKVLERRGKGSVAARVRLGCGSEGRTRTQRCGRRGRNRGEGTGRWKEEERGGADMWARAGSEGEERGGATRSWAVREREIGRGAAHAEGREERGPEENGLPGCGGKKRERKGVGRRGPCGREGEGKEPERERELGCWALFPLLLLFFSFSIL